MHSSEQGAAHRCARWLVTHPQLYQSRTSTTFVFDSFCPPPSVTVENPNTFGTHHKLSEVPGSALP
eukprot:19788-Pleurochrysis_carterae.AAC.1